MRLQWGQGNASPVVGGFSSLSLLLLRGASVHVILAAGQLSLVSGERAPDSYAPDDIGYLVSMVVGRRCMMADGCLLETGG